MKKLFLASGFLFLISDFLFAQNQNVGIGTTSPNARAQLDITSNNKGILIPRLTTTQRNNIVSPPAGLMIYNSTTQNYNVYDGTSWKAMQKELPSGVQILSDTGQSSLSELGFTQLGFMYLNYRPPSIPITIPDSTWYLLNQNDPDFIHTPNNPALGGFFCWIGNELLLLRKDSNFRFNLSTDTWTKNVNAISGGLSVYISDQDKPVWTGTEVIWWNGLTGSSSEVYHFNPQTNVITVYTAPFPLATSYRLMFSMIWTGDKMIVWGGKNNISNVYFNDGGIYNSQTHTWTSITTPSILFSAIPARTEHTAIWTGTEMIVWGGTTGLAPPCPDYPSPRKGYTNSGFRFNPTTLTYTLIPLTNVPQARSLHSAVWSGSEMIIYGGQIAGCDGFFTALQTGAKFNPVLNDWIPIANHMKSNKQQAFWISNQMLLIGCQGGFSSNAVYVYNPISNTWKNLMSSPTIPYDCFWTGDKLIYTSSYPVELNAFSTTPITLIKAQPRKETRHSVWQKN